MGGTLCSCGFTSWKTHLNTSILSSITHPRGSTDRKIA